ncbi:2-polyprenylphenol 6-hydroxylase [Pseudogemmobacter faecipullorum]|uniref:2-polyprenylphenol 6-hydroxylase n=1 Tax=Pseudogemmobacter faecipullorum TaxID=2755041 RepID=A0ABS8CJQ0_9RHOB|nr:2-polyprenylphenol 6-hydroxylase [Pseudogemmobacter faecipullorum]MCB5409586.1 2-polyprenylphenol 6-hydroxylase [Pseudogemmobacter faecipullorum]
MRGPHNIWRLIRTGATFERTGAMTVALEAMEVSPRLRFAARLLGRPFRFLGLKGDPGLPPVTRAITALGPAYIKFGQILSTRPDIVGAELSEQLKYLQDQLPAFPTEEARARIAAEFGQPAEDIYSEFSEPVAAASIAQVHRARLRHNGEEVAVKVLRPGIERAFRRDIDAFYYAAKWIQRLAPFSRRLRPTEVVAHFDSVVRGELDLRLECAEAAEFAENTLKDQRLKVPKPHWAFSGRSVLTIGWAEGIGLNNIAAIEAAGIDRAELGQRVLILFLRHALRDGFFHADMHQGNLKVSTDGDLIVYDFGIMGRIDEYTRRVYAEILMGFIRKDYRRVAEVHFEAGYVPPDRDIDEFARALRSVGEPIFGMEANRISMARLLSYLFEVTEKFGMETRTELILLQRTMVVVEGVARSLDPRLNMWEVAGPVVENYIRTSIGPQALIRDLWRTSRVLARYLPKLPSIAEAHLQALEQKPQQSRPPAGPGLGKIILISALTSLVTLTIAGSILHLI